MPRSDAQAKAREFHFVVWEAVYLDGCANLRSACNKTEVLWRLAELKKTCGVSTDQYLFSGLLAVD